MNTFDTIWAYGYKSRRMLPKTPHARFTPPPGYLTKEGAQVLLNVSRSTVHRLLKAGALMPIRVGIRNKPILFAQADVERLYDAAGGSARIVPMAKLRAESPSLAPRKGGAR